jgi:hypothetical protein
MPMDMQMPMDEEKPEADAMQSAFDSIRQAVDDAEREMVMARIKPDESDQEEEEPEVPEGPAAADEEK